VLVGEAAEGDAGWWCARTSRASLSAVGRASWDGRRAGGLGNGSIETGEGGQSGVHIILRRVALHDGVLAFGETNGVLNTRATQDCVHGWNRRSFHDWWWYWWHGVEVRNSGV
jgi:hypothetical protein